MIATLLAAVLAAAPPDAPVPDVAPPADVTAPDVAEPALPQEPAPLAAAAPLPASHYLVLEFGLGAARDAMGNGRPTGELLLLGRGERIVLGGVLGGDPIGLATRDVRGVDGPFDAFEPGEGLQVPELYYGVSAGVRRPWAHRFVYLLAEAGQHRIWLENLDMSLFGTTAIDGEVAMPYVGARASIRWPFGHARLGSRAITLVVRQDLRRERLVGVTGSSQGDIRSLFGTVGGTSVSLLLSLASDLALPRVEAAPGPAPAHENDPR